VTHRIVRAANNDTNWVEQLQTTFCSTQQMIGSC